MAWVHDTGYAPAYDHTGYPVSVLLDGTETASSSARTASEVIGWRSGCECGWRAMQFYPRSGWPSSTGSAPDGVDGWETGTAAFAGWDRHLERVLPELAVQTSPSSSPTSRNVCTRPCGRHGSPVCPGRASGPSPVRHRIGPLTGGPHGPALPGDRADLVGQVVILPQDRTVTRLAMTTD